MGRERKSAGLRFTAFVLLMTMLITTLYVPAEATTVKACSAIGTVVNISSDLIVRSKASKNGSAIGTLENGENVLITGKTSNWYRISYGTGTGYVSKKYVKAKTLTNSKVYSFSSKACVKVEGNLNVRKKASSSASVIGSLKNNTNITITGVTKNWFRIKYNSGSGFVNRDYIAVGVTVKTSSSSTKSTSSTTSSGTKVGTVNVNTSLVVRESASTKAEVIGGLYNGDQVTITGTKGDFYKISYDGQTAYVMKAYITNVKSGSASETNSTTTTTTTKKSTTTTTKKSTTTSSTVTAVSKTGYANVTTSLIARSKPSADASKIGRYSSGAKIKITGELTNWYRVKYSGTTAYVNAAYVTFTAPKKSSTESSSTTATKTITSYKSIELDVPLYHQYDSRWASVSIGSTNLNSNGCAVTSLAMVEEFRTGATCTPAMMVKKLSFTNSGAVYWPSGTAQYTGSNYLSVIYQQLAAGNPVIVGAKYNNGSQHYIVVYGYDGSSSSLSTSGFLVNDPGTGGTKTLKAYFERSPIFYKLVYYA